MDKTAIILGATGLTGSTLLNLLLQDQRYGKVKVFTRWPLSVKNEKIEEIQCDLLQLSAVKDQFTGDEVFCCIGTTAKKTPNKDLYRKIDIGIPAKAATLCKAQNISTFLVISALGSNAKSSIFYNRTKGKMEQAVLAQKIEHTYIFRPSIIKGARNEQRIGEKMGLIFMKIVEVFLIGPLRKYRGIKATSIAEAMIVVANQGYKHQVISSDKIEKLCLQG